MKKNNIKKSDIKRRKINFNLSLIFAFCIGLITITATYAWFSSSLNAEIDFVKLTVSRETGLYASLDGVNYSNELTINQDTITIGLKDLYPDHTNKWPEKGLVPISSNGTANNDTEYFEFYGSTFLNYVSREDPRKYLDAKLFDELEEERVFFLSFDLFLKNISNSPKSDNLYIESNTNLYINDDANHEMEGYLNSVRFGISRIGHTTDKDASASEVQNIQCNSDCSSYIYEPNSLNHSAYSIHRMDKLNIDMENGVYYPTYGLIKGGEDLKHESGHGNTPLDTEHFALQQTFTDINQSLFEIPHGITKIRVYIWIEGQDLDSLENFSRGADLFVNMGFYKDLAGYDL